MFPEHKMEGYITPPDDEKTGAEGCTTYGSLVIGAEKSQGHGCPLHVTDRETRTGAAVLLYISRHTQDVLSTFHIAEPDHLKGR